MVWRMVEGINAGVEEATVDELFAPRAARRVKGCSRSSAPPSPTGKRRSCSWSRRETRWRDASVARARTEGSSWAKLPRGSAWTWKRSSLCGLRTASSWTSGGWRTAWGGCASWGSYPQPPHFLELREGDLRRIYLLGNSDNNGTV